MAICGKVQYPASRIMLEIDDKSCSNSGLMLASQKTTNNIKEYPKMQNLLKKKTELSNWVRNYSKSILEGGYDPTCWKLVRLDKLEKVLNLCRKSSKPTEVK